MRDDSEKTSGQTGLDLKGLGYLTSIVSVFFLGAIAWPRPDDPAWHLPALIAGMITSVIGMAFRYRAYLNQKRRLRRAEAKAERR